MQADYDMDGRAFSAAKQELRSRLRKPGRNYELDRYLADECGGQSGQDSGVRTVAPNLPAVPLGCRVLWDYESRRGCGRYWEPSVYC